MQIEIRPTRKEVLRFLTIIAQESVNHYLQRMSVLAVNSYLQSTEVKWDGYNLHLNYANEKKRDWQNMAFKITLENNLYW